ncbi:hypothetical protein HZU75_15850 [Chitinibacter fontanus]|uniref:Uncharacterized protein n=1 Tax=Chitinibacter fontanus TaxID=1737446 RepID=A0A7D5VBR8_9NEIS|nr:hypothetical protein [Chitinibacter fontanus]QLI82874.1 hypothetical protein HZU75_15850 [Chitinibacter fontanus]
MKYPLLALSLCLPLLTVQAAPSKASSNASAASKDNPFTKERTQAAGNLSTTLVTIQKMANGCKGKGELSEEIVKKTVQGWQTQNKNYLQVHFDYVSGYLAAIKQVEGEEAEKKALAEMTKFNNDEANKIVKTMIEKDGVELGCKKYFGILASGALDIKEGYPDFKIWKGMLEYSKKSTSAKK